jgi:hypothetical protein
MTCWDGSVEDRKAIDTEKYRKAKVQPFIQPLTLNDDSIRTVLSSQPTGAFYLRIEYPAASAWPFTILIKEVCNSSVHFSCHAERPPERQPQPLPVLHRSQHKNIQNTKIHTPPQLSVPE